MNELLLAKHSALSIPLIWQNSARTDSRLVVLLIYLFRLISWKDGHKLFTPIGDKRHAIAKYVTRYDELKNAQSENEELTYAVQGDDLQE